MLNPIEQKEEWLNKSKPYCNKILVNIPYLRRNMLTLSAFSAAVLLLLAATSLIPLSNLVQPVQAQSSFSFRTTQPASGIVECSSTGAKLTFDAQGAPSSSNPQRVDITGGTFQISDRRDGQVLYSGSAHSGRFSNSSVGGGDLTVNTELNHVANGTSTCASTGDSLAIATSCSTSNGNAINIGFLGQGLNNFGTFYGAVDCSSLGGGDTSTTQSSSSSSSSSMTGTTQQDRDGDGILDANDNCPNLPYTRCYKEGDTAVVVHNSIR
jgi:hypothetical protein